MRANEAAASGGKFPRGEESFQNLLLGLSLAAAQAARGQTSVLLPWFCRAIREFFQADGAYLWQTGPSGELVGTEADGWMADEFRGRRVSLEQSGLVKEAIRQRRAVYLNGPSPEPTQMETDFQARSILAAPVIVSHQVLGASSSSQSLATSHVFQDVTDCSEAERRYREVFDNVQEGLFLATADGRFIEVNDALVQMLGYRTREELLQVDARSRIYAGPEEHRQLVGRLLDEGAVRNYEQTLRHCERSAVHVLIHAVAVRNRQRHWVEYRGAIVDISGLKSFQAELERERDFSGKILEHTQNLVLVLDRAGLIRHANRRCGEPDPEHAQLPGRRLDEILAPAGGPPSWKRSTPGSPGGPWAAWC
jgi:PAS domain S-box-containing protein